MLIQNCPLYSTDITKILKDSKQLFSNKTDELSLINI